jgi:hypothetical protein
MLRRAAQSLDTQISFMSYLKIFPRSIIVKQDGEGGYVGHMAYDFEHYGCMMYDADTAIALLCQWHPQADWLICSSELTHRLTGFVVFMHAMNHYLFNVLQFDPVSQLIKMSDTDYAYYFERVYFDVGTRLFTTVKKTSVADTAESRRGLLRIKT